MRARPTSEAVPVGEMDGSGYFSHFHQTLDSAGYFSSNSLLTKYPSNCASVCHRGLCLQEVIPNHVDTDALSVEQIDFSLSSHNLAF